MRAEDFKDELERAMRRMAEDLWAKAQEENEANLLAAHPVGSYYISEDPTSPAVLFGGTWVQIKDRFLLAAGDTYANAATGGAATVTLTENQIPAHTHTVQWASYNRGSGNLAASVLDYTGSSKQTGSTGGGAAHNNMPPYLAVNVWRRTA